LSWCQAAGYVLIIARAEILYAEDQVGFQALPPWSFFYAL